MFRRTGHREQLTIGPGSSGDGELVEIRGEEAARSLLRDIGGDASGKAALRRLYGEAVGRTSVCNESDEAVLAGLARRMATGQLTVWSAPLPKPCMVTGSGSDGVGAGSGPGGGAASAPPPIRPTRPTWVEIKVVFADTGKPVPSVKLKIKPPSAEASDHTTDKAGLIRIDGIKKSGDCEVTTELSGLKRSEAIAITSKRPPAAPPDEGEKTGDEPAYKLIRIEAYKVKTGNTLEKLAKRVGLSGKELTKFLWDTDDPKEINRHLRWDVGCAKKSGNNYVFDDSDAPGILHMPEPVEMSAPTGKTTVIAVERVVEPKPWLFSL